MAYYYETDDIDWFKLKMEYAGSGDKDINSWTWTDGYSTSLDSYNEDATTNFMTNNEKSVSNFMNGSGTFMGHWMRSFDTMDESGDLMLKIDTDLKANFKMVLPGGIEGKAEGAKMCLSMKECVDNGSSDGSSGVR